METRIGTWNVKHAEEPRLDGLRAELARHGADIWVLTETNDFLVPLNFGFVAHSSPRPGGAEGGGQHGGRWVSIWSRYPILHQVATLDKNNRTVAALIDAPCGQVLMYGTVLPFPTSTPRFVEAVPEQAAEWLKLQRAYPEAAFCVAGDLNTDFDKSNRFPGRAGVEALEEAMHACRLVCATGPGKVPSGWLKEPPIDHVLLPADCTGTVTAAWEGMTTDGTELTDHSGLLVSAQLGPNIERRAEQLRAEQERRREEYRKMREQRAVAEKSGGAAPEEFRIDFSEPSKEWTAKAKWSLRGELSRTLDEATKGKAEVAEPYPPEIIALDGPVVGDVGVWFYKEMLGRVVRAHVLNIMISKSHDGTSFHTIGLARRITLLGLTTRELSLEDAVGVATKVTIEAMAQSVAAGCRLLAKDDALVANRLNAEGQQSG